MVDKQDIYGNRVTVNDAGHIRLKLTQESRHRNLGVFYKNTKTYFKVCKPENVFRKFNAFGFNENVIQVLKPTTVIVEMGGKEYKISFNDFDLYKQYLNFRKRGFELQCFVPLEAFTIR